MGFNLDKFLNELPNLCFSKIIQPSLGDRIEVQKVINSGFRKYAETILKSGKGFSDGTIPRLKKMLLPVDRLLTIEELKERPSTSTVNLMDVFGKRKDIPNKEKFKKFFPAVNTKRVEGKIYENDRSIKKAWFANIPWYVNIDRFVYTLTHYIDDPVTFAKYLKLWYMTGVSEIPEHVIGLFREVVAAKALEKAFRKLETAKIEDLPYLIDSYLTGIKTPIIGEMSAPVSVSVYHQHYTGAYTKIIELTAKDKLKIENCIKDAQWIMKAHDVDIEARIAQLSTENMPLEKIPGFTDEPLENPFLIYNAEKSAKAGKPIYTNVARNLVAEFVNRPKDVEGKGYIPKSAYDLVPEIRAYFKRDTSVLPVSQYDIDASLGTYRPTGKKSNIALWAAGGIAAAFAVSELM